MELEVDGRRVRVMNESGTLLDLLRDQLGITAVKDGCSPQGQCGCCTVLVDGKPRVSCVTPVRRVRDRSITTVEGLDDAIARSWGEAFCATGGSQCGFCTPGIVLRFEGLRRDGVEPSDTDRAARALHAHLCRCTGWQTVIEAWGAPDGAGDPARDLDAASRRAAIEGRSPQRVGAEIALGRGGFAADTAPTDALVAVPDADGGWAVGETLAEARAAAGKVQGRRTTLEVTHPLEVPAGDWVAELRTAWVEPAPLEPDAAWCRPGGEPAGAARQRRRVRGEDDRMGRGRGPGTRRSARPARARPPVARGRRAVGARSGRPSPSGCEPTAPGAPGWSPLPGSSRRSHAVAPGIEVEEVVVPGPPTSTALRAAGWAEAVAVLAAAEGAPGPVTSPEGAVAEVTLDDAGFDVSLRCGDPLDETVLRSYAIGAVHMAYSWVTSEGLAVDGAGAVHDLTIRSFGIVRATEMPPVRVTVRPDDGPPVNGTDAVFAAAAAATWLRRGTPPAWPTGPVPGWET